MITLVESDAAKKDLRRLPDEVLVSYEIWSRLIEEHGLNILRQFKGYHDEKLKGKNKDFRSSRLNKKWRVIYQAINSGSLKVVKVCRITPHEYKIVK